MIGSSGFSGNLNADLRERKSLIDFIKTARLSDLSQMKLNWQNWSIEPRGTAYEVFRQNDFVDTTNSVTRLNRAGLLFLSRILIQFSDLEKGSEPLNDTYVLTKRLRVGKNSGVYLAEHKLLGTKVVAKILRPGASENIVESLQLMSQLKSNSRIVQPIDLFKITKKDSLGSDVDLHCVIYPVVEGVSLREFLSRESYHLNSHIAISYIRQVGDALKSLEEIGAYHGDLHDENILVEETQNSQITFKLIDISFGAMGSLSADECKNSDLTQFRQHLWRIITLQKTFIPRMSLRKFLGSQQFFKVERILSGEFESFVNVMRFAYDKIEQTKFENEKRSFINERFGQPTTFRLQRYEEIIDPSEAARLFVPFAELMSKVKDFSNTYVSGNRGSGKSTYLAALGFFPHALESHVDFREIFGIYFPCRQGEFKSLVGNVQWGEDRKRAFTAHLMVVKIVRRTLEALSSGSSLGRIRTPTTLNRLRKYLNQFVPAPGIVSVDTDLLPELENFASTMVRAEVDLINSNKRSDDISGSFVEIGSLIEFFITVKATFSELSSTRFHILFDDAGTPNLTPYVQKILCDLLLTSNPEFCVKFSAEKFTFDFESSLGKVPENGHDYFEQDISQMLFVGSRNARLPRQELEKYFRRIIEQRLVYFEYRSDKIVDYLGDNQNISNQLIELLAASRQNARYAGWTAVWNIAERTPRNLLEIVSEIFAYGEIEKNSPPRIVTPGAQDKAIRTISHKRLQSLSQVAGYVTVGGQKVSLGRKLYEITASIGSIFRTYLREERGKKRKRQHLAIERNDSQELTAEAREILEKLISFGVLDDTKSEYARDDGVLKPIYVLNRIYCPAFNIIYRRDEHLRLSRKKFELLLLDPESFVKVGTRRLVKNTSDDIFKDGLFGYRIYE